MQALVSLSETLSFELRDALLIYKRTGSARDEAAAFVTKHHADFDGAGVPSLGAGAPISQKDLSALIEELQGPMPCEFLPENVLMRTRTSTVWSTPATTRVMHYDSQSKSEELQQLTGKKFPQPALVFRARGRELDIRALGTDQRPTPDTPLYLAPYWNVYDNGNICLGSTRTPKDASIDSLPLWEKAFFESAFTHANARGKLTEHADGFIGMWKSLIGKKRFPAEHLVNAKQTVAQFLSRP